jgi:cellulose synthase/poly-beta-1,6-N-acetylglucosamine synthase-like glycosyltransferase
VAVLTFRRPDSLRALLPLLVAQAAEVDDRWGPVRVLVVDNDPQGSGRPAVDELAAEPGSGVPVEYRLEPTPGIAAGRNRALAESSGSELLVFIDDDELPDPGWLAHLLQTQQDTGAAAVAGTVTSQFPGPLPVWVEAGGFFDRRRLPTGTRIDVAATNNLALHLPQVRQSGLRFDPRFGLTGGEDTLFTRRLAASGRVMVWCAEAVVTDVVPPERATPAWVMRRAFSSGNSVVRVELALAPGLSGRGAARLRGGLRGAGRLLGGALRWVAGAATGDLRQRARGARTLARGAGMVAGALGHAFAEYAPGAERSPVPVG